MSKMSVGGQAVMEGVMMQSKDKRAIAVRKSNGKISSLPKSISAIRTSFERKPNSEKFPVAPTILRPGPMLLRVAITDVTVVVKSKLSRATTSTDAAKIIT